MNECVVGMLILIGASSCGLKMNNSLKEYSEDIPIIESIDVVSRGGYVDTPEPPVAAQLRGLMTHYCIQIQTESQAAIAPADVRNCVWKPGRSLPSKVDTGILNGKIVITAWARNEELAFVSSPEITSMVVIDTSPPVIGGVATAVSSPNHAVSWPLNYGTVSEPYADYCILENNTDLDACSWQTGSLPDSFNVSPISGSKQLSVWVRDFAGNESNRVDTTSVMLDLIPPVLSSVTLNVASLTNVSSSPLMYGGISESYSQYCIQLNDMDVNHCIFTAGTLPGSIAFPTDGSKMVSVWIRDAAGNTSNRVDSNSIVIDRDTPILGSVTVTNISPTTALVFNLSYGAITGTYSSYCIQENSSSLSSCIFQDGSLPSTYGVTSTENTKILSVWIRDAAGNVSSRADSNGVLLDTTAP